MLQQIVAWCQANPMFTLGVMAFFVCGALFSAEPGGAFDFADSDGE